MNYQAYRGVFNVDINVGATPCGDWDMPLMCRVDASPNELVGFDRSGRVDGRDKWIHFCIHDSKFSAVWRDPWRYLPRFQKFEGIIAPDYSVFWSYPRYMQLEAICRSRAVGAWAQRNGVRAVPFLRWGKSDTYGFAFDAVEPGGTVAVGSVGCMRDSVARKVFEDGFGPMRDAVKPSRILVIGSDKSPVFDEARQEGVSVITYESDTARFFREWRS